MGGAVDQLAAADLAGVLDQQALQIRHVGLGEVLVLAGDQADLLPEVLAAPLLRAVVLLEAGADVVALADVEQRAQAILGIGANQEVDAGTAALRALHQLAELAARPGEHMAGPVHDLGGEQAVGRAIHQEEPDAASLGHTVSA